MALLIDGYNLLHASGILGGGRGPGGLERSRTALLNFVAESIDPRLLSRTTVVFDAREAPPGLPRGWEHRGLRVRFADRGHEADEVIEELILASTSPRRLTVVSSDHRLHRAARRRGATAIDSDVWYADTLRMRIERQRRRDDRQPDSQKPVHPPGETEVGYWLRRFGLDDIEEDSATSPPAPLPPTPPPPPPAPSPPAAATSDEQKPAGRSSPARPTRTRPGKSPARPPDVGPPAGYPQNPFPPGYGEDIE